MSKTNTGVTDLLHQPVGSTLLRFSLPFMASTLLQTLYSATDTVIVGQSLGSAAAASSKYLGLSDLRGIA